MRVPVGSVSGFDLREFDRFAGVGVGGAGDGAGAGLSHPARLSDLRYEALPPPVLLGEVQVAGERRALPAEGAASWASGPVRPLREGVCHAVAVWVDALLPGGGGSEGGGEQGDEEGCWLDGGPAGSPARRQQLHILPSPLDVRPGDALEVVYEPEAPGGARLLLRGAGAEPAAIDGLTALIVGLGVVLEFHPNRPAYCFSGVWHGNGWRRVTAGDGRWQRR